MATTSTRRNPSAEATRYVGVYDWWGRHVWLESGGARSALPYRGDDSMMGFAWGRRGVGARELSRSILHDATGSATLAESLCREFTHDVVAGLQEHGFELHRKDVLSWLKRRRTSA